MKIQILILISLLSITYSKDCTSNEECMNKEKSKCSFVFNDCMICYDNADCLHIPDHRYCERDNNIGCAKCTAKYGCFDKTKSMCLNNQECTSCTHDDHCNHINGSQMCENGVCVQCREDSDCQDTCIDNICQCKSDDDCGENMECNSGQCESTYQETSDGSGCFFKGQTVKIKRGDSQTPISIEIEQITLDDKVLSYSNEQGFFYDKISQAFPMTGNHQDSNAEENTSVKAVTLIIQQYDLNVNEPILKTLKITQNHFVRLSNNEKILAKDVQVGQYVHLIKSEENLPIQGKIISKTVEKRKKADLFHLRTRNLNVVVGNVVASCESKSDWNYLVPFERIFMDYFPQYYRDFQIKFQSDFQNKYTFIGFTYFMGNIFQ